MFADLLKEKGTYVALRVLKPAGLHLYRHFSKAGLTVKQSMFEQRLHVTVLYSRLSHPNLVPSDTKFRSRFKGYDLLTGSKGESVLVMLIESPSLVAHHDALIKEHGATHDFPDFLPHITINYHFNGTRSDLENIPPYPYDIMLGEEYIDDLHIAFNLAQHIYN
jgi:hypothetical protein